MLRTLLLPTVLFGLQALTGGCAPLVGVAALAYPVTFRYDPKPVLLLDAETGLPIRGGTVAVDYSSAGGWIEPYGSRARTDKNGQATLRVTPSSGSMVVAGGTGFNNSGPIPFAKDKQVTTVSIFREPFAQAGITVPTGYRGSLRVIEHSLPDVPPHSVVPGVRHYFTLADPAGITALRPSPPHHRRSDGRDPFDADRMSVARFEDGTPVVVVNRIADGAEPTLHMPTDQLAVWRIGYEMGSSRAYTVFFVGTHAEAMAESNRLEAVAKRSPSRGSFESMPPPVPQKTLHQTYVDLGLMPAWP